MLLQSGSISLPGITNFDKLIYVCLYQQVARRTVYDIDYFIKVQHTKFINTILALDRR